MSYERSDSPEELLLGCGHWAITGNGIGGDCCEDCTLAEVEAALENAFEGDLQDRLYPE
jgi:hypothetical protein